MTVALLDTNVLLALAWPNHQHHAEAHKWFSTHEGKPWGTCALTQLGFIRLSSNPSYTPSAVAPHEAAALLSKLVAHASHRFLSSPSTAEVSIYTHALGHQQVNDAWLVEAARRNRARLVTLDTRLPVHAVKDEVVIIPTT